MLKRVSNLLGKDMKLNSNLGKNEDGVGLRSNQPQGYMLKYKSYIHNACGILSNLILLLCCSYRKCAQAWRDGNDSY